MALGIKKARKNVIFIWTRSNTNSRLTTNRWLFSEKQKLKVRKNDFAFSLVLMKNLKAANAEIFVAQKSAGALCLRSFTLPEGPLSKQLVGGSTCTEFLSTCNHLPRTYDIFLVGGKNH